MSSDSSLRAAINETWDLYELDKLIRQLDSDEYRERKNAEKDLIDDLSLIIEEECYCACMSER